MWHLRCCPPGEQVHAASDGQMGPRPSRGSKPVRLDGMSHAAQLLGTSGALVGEPDGRDRGTQRGPV
eukprot:1330333-Pyramimonas_sp.AAC.1